MSRFLIISIMTDDRPGIVDTLSGLVKQHNGNWLESRMSQLAGKFAGIVKVQVSEQEQDALQQSLLTLKQQGWVINVEQPKDDHPQHTANARLSIVGNDRPGIVKDLAQVLASLAVNVLELNTQFESAAMSAEALFKTKAKVYIPEDKSFDQVADALELLSNDLMVEIQPI